MATRLNGAVDGVDTWHAVAGVELSMVDEIVDQYDPAGMVLVTLVLGLGRYTRAIDLLYEPDSHLTIHFGAALQPATIFQILNGTQK
ncbi:MAG: hypothetical protein V2I33_23640, partial [Kangiellaceae bacterium]|nr:hypothetical protein [Kangiellaceae bacterium]